MHFKALVSASFLALAAAGPALADPASLIASTPSIAVTGHASEWVTPDEARATAVLTGSGTTPAAAITDVGNQTKGIIEIIRKAGIVDADTSSSGPDIEPLYKHVYDAQGHEIFEKREPNGFRATYRLTIRTKDLALLGKLVPQLTDAKATIDTISFEISDLAAIRSRLEAKAVADGVARAKAQIDAAGVKPGRVLAIGTPAAAPMPYERNVMLAKAAPPPAPAMRDFAFAMRPGKEQISADRQVVMEIVQ